jgi:hypothetical protein
MKYQGTLCLCTYHTGQHSLTPAHLYLPFAAMQVCRLLSLFLRRRFTLPSLAPLRPIHRPQSLLSTLPAFDWLTLLSVHSAWQPLTRSFLSAERNNTTLGHRIPICTCSNPPLIVDSRRLFSRIPSLYSNSIIAIVLWSRFTASFILNFKHRLRHSKNHV